ncbi:hypothetical protein J2X04_000776 [Lysobacter niabensis]|uniref:Uncharacterized protein n=1 Tax=Agrilutibacter niabensis TaxID=380628 RepID=A0ABU1VLR6_9GAMM|nr:hypothetical protein [Lysobacter niabensis]
MTGRGGGNRGTHGSQDKDEEEIEARHETSGCYGGEGSQEPAGDRSPAQPMSGAPLSAQSLCVIAM